MTEFIIEDAADLCVEINCAAGQVKRAGNTFKELIGNLAVSADAEVIGQNILDVGDALDDIYSKLDDLQIEIGKQA